MASDTAPFDFDGLPAEMKVLVLSKLQVTELRTCREISACLKATIDSNQATLIEASTKSSMRRFEGSISKLMNYSSEVTFMDAFKVFVQHRELDRMASNASRLLELQAFLEQWYFRTTSTPLASLDRSNRGLELDPLFTWCRTLLATHVFHYAPKGVQNDRIVYRYIDALHRFRRLIKKGADGRLKKPQFNNTGIPQDVSGMYQSVLSNGLVEPAPESPLCKKPVWYITRTWGCLHLLLGLGGIKPQFEHERDRFIWPFCDPSELAQALDIPPIREGSMFAYCARTEWAYEKVRYLVIEGVPLKAWDKARVLEELFIY